MTLKFDSVPCELRGGAEFSTVLLYFRLRF